MARWSLHLFEFEFSVVHQAGSREQATDALTCIPEDGADTTPTTDDIPVAVIDATLNQDNEIFSKYAVRGLPMALRTSTMFRRRQQMHMTLEKIYNDRQRIHSVNKLQPR